MNRRLLLVAESARARLYEMRGGAVRELEDLVHPEGRLHARDLVSDSPGRAFDSAGQGRHSMEPHTETTRTEAAAFARELAHRLEAARAQGEVDAIGLVAPPRFLGLLRDSLDVSTRRLVDVEIDKNLLDVDPEQLAEKIRQAKAMR